jgi:hypothetical protein
MKTTFSNIRTYGLAALALVIGFTACQKNKDELTPEEEQQIDMASSQSE